MPWTPPAHLIPKQGVSLVPGGSSKGWRQGMGMGEGGGQGAQAAEAGRRWGEAQRDSPRDSPLLIASWLAASIHPHARDAPLS